MTTKRNNNTTFLAQEQKALGAIDKYFPNGTLVTIGGVQYTPADLKSVLSDDLAALASVGTQRAALRVGVQTGRQSRAKAHGLLKALRIHIVDQYGAKAAPVLDDFGYPLPPGQVKQKVAAKAQAASKVIATREARHTKGPKQKKGIKGTPAVPASPAK